MINICSTLAPKLSLIGGKPDHRIGALHEILFPMSKMTATGLSHTSALDFSTKHNSLHQLPFC